MDIQNTIRALIFLTVGLLLLKFPKEILAIQLRLKRYLSDKFKIPYKYLGSEFEEKNGVKVNRILGVCFLVIAVVIYLVFVY